MGLVFTLSNRLITLLFFLIFATIGAAEIKPLEQMSTEELIALAQQLPPDQRDLVLQEFVKAEKIARDIVERGRLQLNAATMQAMEENRRIAAQRVLSQIDAHEAEIIAEVQNTVVQHIFVARLYPNAIEGGTLALFNDTSLCEVKRKFSNPIVQALCEMERPEATAHLSPILDPLIAYQCQLPPAFVSSEIRSLCARSPELKGKAYTDPRSNKAYAFLEDLFRNSYEQRFAKPPSSAEIRRDAEIRHYEKGMCGRLYVRAMLYGVYYTHWDSDLSEVNVIYHDLIHRMHACKRLYGSHKRELFVTTGRKHFTSRYRPTKEATLAYCEEFAPAYDTLEADIIEQKRGEKRFQLVEIAFFSTVDYCHEFVQTVRQ